MTTQGTVKSNQLTDAVAFIAGDEIIIGRDGKFYRISFDQVFSAANITFDDGMSPAEYSTVQAALAAAVKADSDFGTDNRLVRTDGTGKKLQSTNIGIDDSSNITINNSLTGAQLIGSGAFAFTGAATGVVNSGASVVADYSGGGRIFTQSAVPISFLTNNAVRLRCGATGGVYHPSATDGDKGNNTINFGAVYDDGSLLTCYPFEQYLDGTVTLAKWDAKVPDLDYEEETIEPLYHENGEPRLGKNGEHLVETRIERKYVPRRHEPARKFKARIGTEYDPLTLDGYAKHWKEKRHLPAMPNEEKYDPIKGKLDIGSWIQRLVETVETQAILIDQLHERIKSLEAI